MFRIDGRLLIVDGRLLMYMLNRGLDLGLSFMGCYVIILIDWSNLVNCYLKRIINICFIKNN